MTTDPEVILNAYAEGKANAAFHDACGDNLTAAANHTLTWLSTAGFGAVAYAAHLFEVGARGPAPWAVLAGAVHLLVVSAGIIWKCLSSRPAYPPSNEAKNLVHPGFSWVQIVETEIGLLADRVSRIRARNELTGRWLNRLRYAALAAPLTFALAWGLAAAAGS